MDNLAKHNYLGENNCFKSTPFKKSRREICGGVESSGWRIVAAA